MVVVFVEGRQYGLVAKETAAQKILGIIAIELQFLGEILKKKYHNCYLKLEYAFICKFLSWKHKFLCYRST